MFFNDKITHIKLKLLGLLLIAANYSFAQNYATCAIAGNTVTVNGNCLVRTVSTNPFEAPASATYPCLTPEVASMDCWMKFVATASTATIAVTTTNTALGPAFAVYNGPCTAGVIAGGQLNCTNNVLGTAAQTETGSLTGLSIGTTYWVRVMRTGTAATAGFTICINSSPDNDEPTSSVVLPAVTGACAYSVGNIKNGTQTTCGGLANPSCGSYGAGSADVWYSVNVPASGNLFIQTAGTMSMGIASYTGTPCTSLTQMGCSEGNPEGASTGAPSLYVPGLAPGTTVYIRVWNKNGAAPTSFSICATNLGPCGNLPNNDYCSNPAPVSTSGATFTSVATNSTTAGIYSADSPGNLINNTCSGGIGENAWFSFIATTTSQSIPFSVTGCAGGLEAEVFSVAINPYGCCKTFTPVSSGYPSCTSYSIANNSSGTVTASPLTIGNTYYLMLNSATGTTCNYTVTGWSTSGILPTELISFIGSNEGKYNNIEWITSNENNVKSYTLEHSDSGDDFIPIATINAKGNNTSNTIYRVLDNSPFDDITYYRVKHTEIGGIEKYSNIISVNLKGKYDNIYNIHPNPTNSNLNFEFYSKTNSTINIELINYAGASVLKLDQLLDEGKNNIILPMAELDKGVYILNVISGKSGKTTHHKIIKN